MGLNSAIFDRFRSFWFYHLLLFICYIGWSHFIQKLDLNYFRIILLIVAYIFTGIGGYLVNDFFDRQQDKVSGKSNVTSGKNNVTIWLIITFCWLISFTIIFKFSIFTGILLVFQFLLLFAYSAPQIRLKEKPILGIITDALYAHVVPLIILLVFLKISFESISVITLLLFSCTVGLRDILLHQKFDKENDLKSNSNSFAIKFDKEFSYTMVILQFLMLITLLLFFVFTFNSKEYLFEFMIGVLGCIALFFSSIFYLNTSLKNNYILRFFILFSIAVLNIWLIPLENYSGLILLLHPYFFDLMSWLKSNMALLFNHFLYTIFKLFGRNLKEKPLIKRDEK